MYFIKEVIDGYNMAIFFSLYEDSYYVFQHKSLALLKNLHNFGYQSIWRRVCTFFIWTQCPIGILRSTYFFISVKIFSPTDI